MRSLGTPPTLGARRVTLFGGLHRVDEFRSACARLSARGYRRGRFGRACEPSRDPGASECPFFRASVGGPAGEVRAPESDVGGIQEEILDEGAVGQVSVPELDFEHPQSG